MDAERDAAREMSLDLCSHHWAPYDMFLSIHPTNSLIT